LQDPRAKHSEKLKPLVHTIKKVVRDFFALAEGGSSSGTAAVGTGSSNPQNRLVFVEVLFRKGRPHERCLALANCYYGMAGDHRTREDDEFIEKAHDAGLDLAGDAHGGGEDQQNASADEDAFEGEAEFGDTFGSDADDGVVEESRSDARQRMKEELKRKRKEKRKSKKDKGESPPSCIPALLRL
jgi:hypothetical protein